MRKVYRGMVQLMLAAAMLLLSQFVYAQENASSQTNTSAVSPTDVASIEEKFATYSQLLSPEKLYLHTDREVYCVGDTIWFKGYLQNSSQLSEFAESNYIYVELLSPMIAQFLSGKVGSLEEMRRRVKVKRINDTFYGFLKIPEKLNTGIAVVRAYSYWMINHGEEYMFSKNIELRNPLKDDYVQSLVKKKEYSRGEYTKIGMESPFARRKDEGFDIDIQFMPESGRYVVGENSVIAFKAIDNEGMGLNVKGAVYIDDADSVVFESNELGLGVINLNLAKMPEKLQVRVGDYEGFSKTVEFPMPERQAVVMNVKIDSSVVTADVYSKNINTDTPLWFVVYNTTEMYVKTPFTLLGKRYKLAYDLFSPGINNAAIVDDNGNVYANRSFFIYPKGKTVATLQTDKSEYKEKEKVLCDIELKDENGNPLNGNFSLSVSDDEYAPYSGYGYNIVSYMQLGSEIKGFVEDPQEYFNAEKPLAERMASVDLLMLAQGWKYYDLPKILTNTTVIPKYGKEYTQSISGKIRGWLRMPKKSIVSFVAPSIGFTAMGQLDSTGYFALNNIDFPDSTKFIVSGSNAKGKGKFYTPILNEELFADLYSYPRYLTPYGYTKEYKMAAYVGHYDSNGEPLYSLDPVYVTAPKRINPRNLSPMPNAYFKPGQYRDIEEMAPYKDFDVISYIAMTCHPLRQGGGNAILCQAIRRYSRMQVTGAWQPIAVYINGMRATFDEMAALMVSDIDGFAYIKSGADASRFSMSGELFPPAVVMVRTKWAPRQLANITAVTPLGWQKPKKMYSPKYETDESKKGKEAMRSTVHWQPNVNVVNGKAESSFYTSAHLSDYTVILEGLTSDKKPVFVKTKIKRVADK